jgi:hypothetical protein
MSRPVVGFVGLLCVATIVAAAEDTIGADLAKAKDDYAAKMAEFRGMVGDWLKKQEKDARDTGNRKRVVQLQAERAAFEDKGEVPKGAPEKAKKKAADARAAMEKAYEKAISEYTKKSKDNDAEAVEKERDAFRADPAGQDRAAMLVGRWIPSNPPKGKTMVLEMSIDGKAII